MQDTIERTEGLTLKNFRTEQKSTWCPGCGDFGILSSVQQALIKCGIAPHQAHIVAGIGCGSKLPDYMTANGYMTLHGRGVTIGCGAHLANRDLVTLVVGGDGDSFGIGLGHAVHNMRRNMDIVHIVENNEVYGLTKGQYSPTSKQGFITSTSPEGAIEYAINPGGIALTAGATFIAYAYSGDPKFTAEMLAKAIEHKGYAIVNILQTCPSYNRSQTNDWFKENMFKIEEAIPNYDNTSFEDAYKLVYNLHDVWKQDEYKNKLYPQGVIYQNNERPTYGDQVHALSSNEKPLVQHDLTVSSELFDKLKESYI